MVNPAGACKEVIEHGVEIVNLKDEQKEIWEVIRDMGKVATRIYIAVLVVLLTVLFDIISRNMGG